MAKQRKQEAEAKGLFGKVGGKLPPTQLNAHLLKYPQPKDKL